MEFSLHRQLKEHYGAATSRTEVRVDGFRIDAIGKQGRLIEIQHSSLAAIRGKVARLLEGRRVLVVKPLIGRKHLVRLAAPGGDAISRRQSPKRESPLDLFRELVYFTKVFPHRNLWLDVMVVEVEELRYPGHGRRRRWRENDFQVADQRLLGIDSVQRFRRARDLWSLLPAGLSDPFDTGELARRLGVHRSFAQQIAYCLRHCGAAREVGKTGNARLYSLRAAA